MLSHQCSFYDKDDNRKDDDDSHNHVSDNMDGQFQKIEIEYFKKTAMLKLRGGLDNLVLEIFKFQK